MSHTSDCPVGRSQLFTFKAKETITVDRPTRRAHFCLVEWVQRQF